MANEFNEPWKLKSELHGEHDGCATIRDAIGGQVCTDFEDATYHPDAPSEDQMRRIVACVNACAGVPTELIEKISPAAMQILAAGVKKLDGSRPINLTELCLADLEQRMEAEERHDALKFCPADVAPIKGPKDV